MSEQELQQEFDEQVEELDDQLEQEVEEVQEEQEEQDDTPKGFLSYEQYIEEGGDPDMYRGKKAFAQFYDKNQEIKSLKNDIKEVKTLTKTMAQAQQEAHNKSTASLIAKFEDQMASAKESLDFEAYEKAAQEKANLQKQSIAKAPESNRPHQDVINDFRVANPALDYNSGEYDPDLDRLVVDMVNKRSSKMNMSMLDANDINELLNESFDQVKSKFVKYQQKAPKTPPKTRQAAKKMVKTTGIKVSELTSSQRGVYDTVLEASGEEAAKNFLKNIGE